MVVAVLLLLLLRLLPLRLAVLLLASVALSSCCWAINVSEAGSTAAAAAAGFISSLATWLMPTVLYLQWQWRLHQKYVHTHTHARTHAGDPTVEHGGADDDCVGIIVGSL